MSSGSEGFKGINAGRKAGKGKKTNAAKRGEARRNSDKKDSAGPALTGGGSMSSVENRIRTQNFESAAIYQNGKQVFFTNGQASSVSFTDAEVALARGGVLTHNHPGSRSFSPADVTLFTRNGMGEIRAVSRQYNYSLKANPGSNTSVSKAAAAYKKAERQVRGTIQGRVNAGTLTQGEANQIHHHEVMGIVANKLGLTYTRTKAKAP